MTENKRNPVSPLGIVLGVLGLAVLVAIVWYAFNAVNRTIRQTLSPIQMVNEQLSTQVYDLLHPTPTVIPDPVTIINEVRAVAKLETIHYTVEKVVTAETRQGLLAPFFGDRRECLIKWVNEVLDVKSVVWELAAHKLAMVVAVGE